MSETEPYYCPENYPVTEPMRLRALASTSQRVRDYFLKVLAPHARNMPPETFRLHLDQIAKDFPRIAQNPNDPCWAGAFQGWEKEDVHAVQQVLYGQAA